MFVLCYLCIPRWALVWPAMCYCDISLSYSLFCFGQVLHQATRLENLVQLFNAESHAIGIKPVHRIDDVSGKYVFDKFVKRHGYVPDNSDTEWYKQFSLDIIAFLKATVDSK